MRLTLTPYFPSHILRYGKESHRDGFFIKKSLSFSKKDERRFDYVTYIECSKNGK